MTIYRWMKNSAVLRRAYYLTSHKRIQGALIARREWPWTVQAMNDEANAGNVAAAKWVREEAWLQGTQLRREGLSVMEMMRQTFNDGDEDSLPTGMMEDKIHLTYSKAHRRSCRKSLASFWDR
jgi:hypothetical protein